MSTEEDLELLELQSQRKWGEALAMAKEAASRMKREDLMVQELKAAKRREDRMWHHIKEIKRRELELLEDQRSRKKREEDLLQERDGLQQERDGLKAELDACLAVCNSAISREKWLEANIVSRDKKHEEVENDLVSRLAVEEAERERMRQSLWSLLTPRDAKIESLQAQIAEMTQKHAVEMAEKDAKCKEVIDSISCTKKNLYWQAGFFAQTVRRFKDMLPGSRKRPAQGEAATVTRKAPPKSTLPGTSSHERENAGLPGLQILESEVAALLREFGDAYFAMNQATIAWLGKPLIQVGECFDLEVQPMWSEAPGLVTVNRGAENSLQRSTGAPNVADSSPASEEPITTMEKETDHMQGDPNAALCPVNTNGSDAVPASELVPSTTMENEEADQMQEDPIDELSQENIDLLNEIWAGTWSPAPESDVSNVKTSSPPASGDNHPACTEAGEEGAV